MFRSVISTSTVEIQTLALASFKNVYPKRARIFESRSGMSQFQCFSAQSGVAGHVYPIGYKSLHSAYITDHRSIDLL